MPPPPPGAAGAGFSSFRSTTTHSVVSSRPAIDAAFCSAVRVTLVGSMTPALTRSSYASVGGVVAEVLVLRLLDLGHDDRAFGAGVLRDHPDAALRAARRTISTPIFSSSRALDLVEHRLRAEQRDAAAGHDALFDGRAGRVQRVLDAGLLLLHLGLGRGADVDHRHAAGQLGQPLLQLLAVVVAGRLVDRDLDLGDAALDVVGLAGAVDDRGVVLVDHDPLGAAEVGQHRVLELEADFLGDDLAAGEHRDVAQHLLAAIAEARRLDGGDLERAAELVDDQRRQRLALDVLGDDQQRLAGLGDLLQHREQVLHRGDLLVVDEDVGVLEHGFHLLRIGDEVGREVAAVELHALDRLQRGLEALGLLDRDHAVLADLLHRLGDQVADLRVVVRGDGADLGDLLLAGGRDWRSA